MRGTGVQVLGGWDGIIRMVQDPETDRYLKAALEKFASSEKTRRLRLVPKGTQQLRLFE